MSKGMRNLIAMTAVCQRWILEVGINEITKYVKITDNKDCLPCEITRYRQAEFKNMDDLKSKVKQMEDLGYSVCVDVENMFYETGE